MNTQATTESASSKQWYKTEDLAARWDVSRWTIQRLAKSGQIKASHIRGSVRYSAKTIEAYESKRA